MRGVRSQPRQEGLSIVSSPLRFKRRVAYVMNENLLAVESLTTHQISRRLGVPDREVLLLEEAGDLFSYVRPNRSSEKLFPAYQLAAEIRPHLLRMAGRVLGLNGPLLDTFFNSRDPDLADLSVREVLAGKAFSNFTANPDAAWLLAQSFETRMEAVLGALERLRAVTQDGP